MHEMDVGEFDITHTIQSAQPLTFFGDERKDGRGVAYAYGNSIVEVEQNGGKLSYEAYGGIGAAELKREVLTRFRLNDDMRSIYRRISTDPFLRDAVKRYRGMRVTKNDPWEATLCFVISQFNNVKRIRGIVKSLIAAYGEEHTFRSGNLRLSFHSFPTPEALASRSVKELMTHGAGFRAKYIRSVAQECNDSFELRSLEKQDYESAKRELMTLDGVGDKVADCILLFGYGRLESFPTDTWIKRIVERTYFKGRKQSIRAIHTFAEERWGAYAGYAQQYLFHKARLGEKGTMR
jgi:N-glycosylase/DNA lyase